MSLEVQNKDATGNLKGTDVFQNFIFKKSQFQQNHQQNLSTSQGCNNTLSVGLSAHHNSQPRETAMSKVLGLAPVPLPNL